MGVQCSLGLATFRRKSEEQPLTPAWAVVGNDWLLVKDSGIPFPSASGSHLWLQPSLLYPKCKEGAFAEGHMSTLCASLQRRFPGGLTEQGWLTAPCSGPCHRSPLCKGSHLSGWSYCDSGQSEFFRKEKWPNNYWVGCQWLLIYLVNPTELGPESHQGSPLHGHWDSLVQESQDSPSWFLCFPFLFPRFSICFWPPFSL